MLDATINQCPKDQCLLDFIGLMIIRELLTFSFFITAGDAVVGTIGGRSSVTVHRHRLSATDTNDYRPAGSFYLISHQQLKTMNNAYQHWIL